VRDSLLGLTPNDWDICTDATPEEMKATLPFRTVDTGIKHGTVSLIINKNQYEITTYRVDGEYKDARRPESVSFTDSLAEDLCRRDFTVNAMCYSPKHGFTDLHNGREDVEDKIIRAVGDPLLRFSEDALRILRALRFSAVLGFEIEEATSKAAFLKKDLLSFVSGERIYVEWKKLIGGVNAYSVLEKYVDIISVFMPEISSLVLPQKEAFLREDGFVRTLAVFSLTLGNEAQAAYSSVMRRLKTDRETEVSGRDILNVLGKYDLSSRIGVRKALASLSQDKARVLIRLSILLGMADEDSEELLDSVLSSEIPFKISDLSVSGDDLISLGASGREIGRILNHLLLLVIEERLPNDRAKLLAEALKEISAI
jgi:tRNA nucleotidyltransferase (CCA-adding enzyme)